MDEHPRLALIGQVMAFLLAVVVAVAWYRADLYPEQIPQTRIEFIEAVASVMVIGINILSLIVLASRYGTRRAHLAEESSAPRPPRPLTVAGCLVQLCISVVASLAILCLVFIAVRPLQDTSETPQVSSDPPTAFPVYDIAATVLTAEGYGKARPDSQSPSAQKQSAILAAKLDGTAEIAKQLVGITIQVLQLSNDSMIDESQVLIVVNAWMPSPEIVHEQYNNTTGEAFVQMQLRITEAEREELRTLYMQK